MALREVKPTPVDPKDLEGTIWQSLHHLHGGGKHPFQVESPAESEKPQLVAGEVRTITFRGSGEILQFNIDLPAGVTLAVVIDGSRRRYSHGNEQGIQRWAAGESPYRFQSSLELVLTNTTGAGAPYKVYVSGV